MFSCDASGGDFTFWRVNGTSSISDLDIEIEYQERMGSGLSILTITARAVYNGTTVQCVTGDVGGVAVESDIVTLTIQGIHTANDMYNTTHVHTYHINMT